MFFACSKPLYTALFMSNFMNIAFIFFGLSQDWKHLNGMLSMSNHKTILEDEKYECLTRIIAWLFLDTQYQTYLCKIYIKTLSKWSFGG